MRQNLASAIAKNLVMIFRLDSLLDNGEPFRKIAEANQPGSFRFCKLLFSLPLVDRLRGRNLPRRLFLFSCNLRRILQTACLREEGSGHRFNTTGEVHAGGQGSEVQAMISMQTRHDKRLAHGRWAVTRHQRTLKR